MISTSDIVILVVASGALATGVYRWHTNTQDVSAITIPANSRMVIEPEPIISSNNKLKAVKGTTSATVTNTQADTPVVKILPDATVVTSIVVPTTESQSLGTHTVESGDYLSKLAQQFNTDTQTLKDLNNLSGSVIYVGDEILYPL